MLLAMPMLVWSQGGSEIYLLSMQVKGKKITVSNPANISNHKGYDNQPFFSLKEPVLYFTTARDSGNTDIRVYNYHSGAMDFFTNTADNEYSATVTPDGKFVSCIIARRSPFAQDLGRFPVRGGAPEILISQLVVGYHAWMDEERLLLFVLDGNAGNSLHFYNLRTKEDKILSTKPGRSLWKIPGENAMSFVDKTDSANWRIKRLDIATMQVTDIGATLPKREDMCWTGTGLVIMSNGTELFSLDPKTGEGWQKILFDFNDPAIKGITRLAVNADNSKMAIVVQE